MRAPISSLRAAGGFDLTTLDTSWRLKAGDYNRNVGGESRWVGTASAGTSALRMAQWGGTNSMLDGDDLGGGRKAVLTTGGTQKELDCTLTAAPATTVPASDIFGAAEGFIWALLKIDSAVNSMILSNIAGGVVLWMFNGAPGDRVRLEVGGFAINLGAVYPASTWCVVNARWSAGIKQLRVNKGAWGSIAWGGAPDLTQYMRLGSSFGGAFAGQYGDIGCCPTTKSDATSDLIYDGLSALYPGAALP